MATKLVCRAAFKQKGKGTTSSTSVLWFSSQGSFTAHQNIPCQLACFLQLICFFSHSYVSLSDNEKTGYKARELKSVYVDAVGQYLKLTFHKNYVNRYNLYGQVRGVYVITLTF